MHTFKKVISVFFQTILFYLVYGAGSFLPRLHLTTTLVNNTTETRIFIWDGIVLMFALYLVIVTIWVAMKRIRTSAARSTIALVLALLLGMASKFGFKTIFH